MDVYLPIAEVAVSAPLLMILGGAVGFISGLFGIGGGFLMTPILVWSASPRRLRWQRSQPRHRLLGLGLIAYRAGTRWTSRWGGVLAAGGALGALLGVEAFRVLLELGQADLVVSLAYLLFSA
jgi:uncharacterized membrane protein YfcA